MLDRLKAFLTRLLRAVERPNPWDLSVFEHGALASVPDAIGSLFRLKGADREKLAHQLAAFMRALQPEEWDQELRSPRMTPDQVALLGDFDRDTAVELLGIASFSMSGYAREAAINSLQALRHPRAVPYILLRLGDWVEQVRDAAWRSLRALMHTGIEAELLNHHPLVQRLEQVTRVDLYPAIAEIHDYLRSEKARPNLLKALDSRNVSQRLFVYRLLEAELGRELVLRAASDASPAVRLWIARRLAAKPPAHADIFVRLLRDPASSVCTTAVGSLAEDQVESLRDDLVELALSDHRGVREAARYALRVTPVDLAAESRRRIQQEHVSPGVVASLGETGTREDFNLVQPFLTSRRSRVRAAAVEACVRLRGDEALPEVVPLLDDASGRVRRAVVAVLVRADLEPWRARICDILEQGTPGGQAQALGLVAARGGWEAVPDLLRGLRSQSEGVRERAWRYLSAWHARYRHRGWLKPTEHVRAALREQLSGLEGVLVAPPIWSRAAWADLEKWLHQEAGSGA